MFCLSFPPLVLFQAFFFFTCVSFVNYSCLLKPVFFTPSIHLFCFVMFCLLFLSCIPESALFLVFLVLLWFVPFTFLTSLLSDIPASCIFYILFYAYLLILYFNLISYCLSFGFGLSSYYYSSLFFSTWPHYVSWIWVPFCLTPNSTGY